MKVESYFIGSPVDGFTKQWAVWCQEGSKSAPLVYLQRPKWIVDDAQWETIVNSISVNLPFQFEVTQP